MSQPLIWLADSSAKNDVRSILSMSLVRENAAMPVRGCYIAWRWLTTLDLFFLKADKNRPAFLNLFPTASLGFYGGRAG